MSNLAYEPLYQDVLKKLKDELTEWQNITADPWICSPWGIYEYQGRYKGKPQCLALNNGISNEVEDSINVTNNPSIYLEIQDSSTIFLSSVGSLHFDVLIYFVLIIIVMSGLRLSQKKKV